MNQHDVQAHDSVWQLAATFVSRWPATWRVRHRRMARSGSCASAWPRDGRGGFVVDTCGVPRGSGADHDLTGNRTVACAALQSTTGSQEATMTTIHEVVDRY